MMYGLFVRRALLGGLMAWTITGGAVAAEEIKGPACVSDAGHLAINGKRSYGACQGGTPVTLANLEAPPLAQTCTTPAGQDWPCGRWAAYFLLEMVKSKTVTCRVRSEDAQGNKVALCLVERLEINQSLVNQGWALAAGTEGRYYDAQDQAKAQKVGLWQGTFLRPSEWLARNNK